MVEKTLYERLGGVFAIAAVVDHFSDAVLANPLVGKGSPNGALREWSNKESGARLPGLKFMRTLWVCSVTGGPFAYDGAGQPLGTAHQRFHITPAEFDEVAAELGRTLDHFRIPTREAGEVLGAFAAHKAEVTAVQVHQTR
jgi:hemoglobin